MYIRQWTRRQTLERTPSLRRRIEPPRIQGPISVRLLRPDHPYAIGAVHRDLRQPIVAAGPGDPLQVLPLAVAITPDRDIIPIPAEAQPRRPERSVGRGGQGRQIILAIFMADHR